MGGGRGSLGSGGDKQGGGFVQVEIVKGEGISEGKIGPTYRER